MFTVVDIAHIRSILRVYKSNMLKDAYKLDLFILRHLPTLNIKFKTQEERRIYAVERVYNFLNENKVTFDYKDEKALCKYILMEF